MYGSAKDDEFRRKLVNISSESLKQLLDDIMIDKFYLGRMREIASLGHIIENIKKTMMYNSRLEFISPEEAVKIVKDIKNAGWLPKEYLSTKVATGRDKRKRKSKEHGLTLFGNNIKGGEAQGKNKKTTFVKIDEKRKNYAEEYNNSNAYSSSPSHSRITRSCSTTSSSFGTKDANFDSKAFYTENKTSKLRNNFNNNKLTTTSSSVQVQSQQSSRMSINSSQSQRSLSGLQHSGMNKNDPPKEYRQQDEDFIVQTLQTPKETDSFQHHEIENVEMKPISKRESSSSFFDYSETQHLLDQMVKTKLYHLPEEETKEIESRSKSAIFDTSSSLCPSSNDVSHSHQSFSNETNHQTVDEDLLLSTTDLVTYSNDNFIIISSSPRNSTTSTQAPTGQMITILSEETDVGQKQRTNDKEDVLKISESIIKDSRSQVLAVKVYPSVNSDYNNNNINDCNPIDYPELVSFEDLQEKTGKEETNSSLIPQALDDKNSTNYPSEIDLLNQIQSVQTLDHRQSEVLETESAHPAIADSNNNNLCSSIYSTVCGVVGAVADKMVDDLMGTLVFEFAELVIPDTPNI